MPAPRNATNPRTTATAAHQTAILAIICIGYFMVVRHRDTEGDAVYVRSVNGTFAAWYRGVQTRHEGELTAGRLHRDVVFVEAGEHAGGDGGLDDALDAAYRTKYGRSSSAVAPITAAAARATTLRVDPA